MSDAIPPPKENHLHTGSLQKKFLLIAVIVGLIIISYALGLPDYFSLENIRQYQLQAQDYYRAHPLLSVLGFAAVYIPTVALNIPGAVLLGLAAGTFFGTLVGTIVVSFSSTIGATLACLSSRYLLRDWVQKKLGNRLNAVNQGIKKEGAFYLFTLRLIPAFPFFAINMLMGLTPIRLSTFYWVSQIGMLPGTAIYVNAGSQIGTIESAGDIFSGPLLLSLALLGVFPLIAKKLINIWKKRNENSEKSDQAPSLQSTPEAEHLQKFTGILSSQCTGCGICASQCALLQRHGLPREIFPRFQQNSDTQEAINIAYSCSLCGLCHAVCPEELDPCSGFLAARRLAAARGQLDMRSYRAILSYEKTGRSPLFTLKHIPDGCDTIFFPGCTLPGTRPETTWQLYTSLREQIPHLGIVLDCCTKPSHDLGRQNFFQDTFNSLKTGLIDAGIKRVLVACPNCHKIFRDYAGDLRVETVYEQLAQTGAARPHSRRSDQANNPLVVHDPCPMRYIDPAQQSVRMLLERSGYHEERIPFQGKKTLCCGEGGSVGFIAPELATAWTDKRSKQAQGRTIVTYCAGCAGFLGRRTATVHLLDLLFGKPDSKGNYPVKRAPFTYFNRLNFKRKASRM